VVVVDAEAGGADISDGPVVVVVVCSVVVVIGGSDAQAPTMAAPQRAVASKSKRPHFWADIMRYAPIAGRCCWCWSWLWW
jgi:hypothetical protein